MRDAQARQVGTAPALSRRHFLRRAWLLCTLAPLAACTTSPEQERPLIKMLPQNQLDPASLAIHAGTTVIWYNTSPLPQTATCDPAKTKDKTHVVLPKGAQPWDSGPLYPGQTWSYTFVTPGMYLFFSLLQDVPSMVGLIKVSA